jgi:hypothetical protein
MTHFLTGVLDPELNFLLVMLDSIWVVTSVPKTIGIVAVINLGQAFEAPFMIKSLACGVPLLQYDY